MGRFLAQGLGVTNEFNASNPYDPSTLDEAQKNARQLYGQQQGLGQTLQDQIAGRGPNPAQTQYLQNIAQNQANAQGLIASQRGLNPALAARLGANNLAASNAQAAGNAAMLQQQQQLQATQNYGALLGQMQQGNLGQQGLYVHGQGNQMAANLQAQLANQKAAQGVVGGVLGGAGAAMGMPMAEGGQVPSVSVAFPAMEIQGDVQPGPKLPDIDFLRPLDSQPAGAIQQPASRLAQALKVQPLIEDPVAGGFTRFGAGLGDRLRASQSAAGAQGQTGQMAAIPSAAIAQARGGEVPGKSYKRGGQIPGKAKGAYDSYANDTVPIKASPGEVMIPNSITQLPHDEAIEKGAKFLAAVLAKKGRRK